ncbi:MAG: Lpp/OprI family alanine-zipper lipoprotein [Proteobacteria bacterium]|nr:Lpp/OprI family alanine-zipper lipoprotein [Pseudomonadota bacterium]
MQKILSLTLKMTAIAVTLGVLSGCASVKPEQLAAVEAKASSAESAARSAESAAKSALDAANAANAAAAKAQSTADAALTCCGENKDRIERMFEHTMKK